MSESNLNFAIKWANWLLIKALVVGLCGPLFGCKGVAQRDIDASPGMDFCARTPELHLVVTGSAYDSEPGYTVEVFSEGRCRLRTEFGAFEYSIDSKVVPDALESLAGLFEFTGYYPMYNLKFSMEDPSFFLFFRVEGGYYCSSGPLYGLSPLQEFRDATMGQGHDGFEDERANLLRILSVLVDFESISKQYQLPSPTGM